MWDVAADGAATDAAAAVTVTLASQLLSIFHLRCSLSSFQHLLFNLSPDISHSLQINEQLMY